MTVVVPQISTRQTPAILPPAPVNAVATPTRMLATVRGRVKQLQDSQLAHAKRLQIASTMRTAVTQP